MTTGEPSVPKTAARPAAKKAAPKAGASEPRVTASRGGSAMKRPPRTAGSKREADVLDRLNRLAEPVPLVDPALEPVSLPPIIEADPTFPPAQRPTEVRTEELAVAAPTMLTTVVDEPTIETPPPSPVEVALAPTEMLSPGVIDAPPLTEVVPVMPVMPPLDDLVTSDEGLDESTGTVLPTRALQRPVTFKRGKPRVRRVTRVVRHVDTWSVFKVALVFNVIFYMVCLTAGVLLWNVAHATGTVDNVEKFFEQFGWSSFEFNGGEIYHDAWVAGLFVSIGFTGLAVLMATLFNLITDLVGGVRVSVLEEEVVARAPSRVSDRLRGDSTRTG